MLYVSGKKCKTRRVLGVRLFFVLASIFLSIEMAFSEEGAKVGCINDVGYIHIPSEQFHKAVIFKRSGLPRVSEVETLPKETVFYYTRTFSDSDQNLIALKERLQKAVRDGGRVSGGPGSELGKNAKIRILSFVTFPQLDTMSNELFALIQILSD